MNNLKKIRMKKHYSQEKLAYEAGITVRYVAFLESGKRKPSLDVAFKISGILNSNVEDIFLAQKCTKRT